MHVYQAKKVEELMAALGILARAQEHGAGEGELLELTVRVKEAEDAFRAVCRLSE